MLLLGSDSLCPRYRDLALLPVLHGHVRPAGEDGPSGPAFVLSETDGLADGGDLVKLSFDGLATSLRARIVLALHLPNSIVP